MFASTTHPLPETAAPAAADPPSSALQAGALPGAPTDAAPGPAFGGAEPPTFDAPPGAGGAPPATARRWPRRPHGARLLALVALVALLLGAGGGAAIAAGMGAAAGHTTVIGAPSAPSITLSSGTESLKQSVEKVVAAVQPSVVKVTGVAGGQESIGSGDILTADGYIVTNDHVVRGYSSFTVTLSDGTTKQAQLVGEDPQDDLAVLKIAATNLHPIAFADSSAVQVGEFAIVVGNPLGLQQSAAFGIVSALNRTASEAPNGPAGELTGLVQTSAPLNPGNSGGALVNLEGQLIGIPTLSATNPETGSAATGIGYAIPASRVEYVATQLIQSGHLTSTGQGFLGVQAQDVTPRLAAADGLSVQSGVLITGFANDAAGSSPARQAGLQAGDVIVAVNGSTVGSNDDLAAALLNQAPGSKATLTVMRGTSQRTVTVTLGERPTNAQG